MRGEVSELQKALGVLRGWVNVCVGMQIYIYNVCVCVYIYVYISHYICIIMYMYMYMCMGMCIYVYTYDSGYLKHVHAMVWWNYQPCETN